MKLVRVCLLAVLISCGGSNTGDDDGMTPTVDDADGDTISDVDEGIATARDTDGDGTPDYQDDDSDGDGIPDYREAGDGDVTSKPVDSDGDGMSDFIDTDSDNNGRDDGLDGLDDTDGDGIADFQDRDDDRDSIDDVDELGPNPLQPLDSDNDGTPDFRDTDSDRDTLLDRDETNLDYDGDGTPNYLDSDSDNDCIPDMLEAGSPPPVDSDGDNRFDFVDRDSDDDGIVDGAEDKNCNGVVDAGESSATNDDTDGDGVSDMIEVAAGTDPTSAADNPQANGDFVFIEPYMKPQTPTDDDLDFSTKLQAVDLYVLLDRSGSMSSEITSVKNNLTTVVNNLKCPPNVTTNCIPDLWAGAGTIGYSGSGIEAYRNYVDIQPNPSFAALPTSEPGGCCAEPLTFGAYAAVTGSAGSSFGLSGVPARSTCAGSPAANAGYGTFGYPCFRQGALPVVMLATDEPPFTTYAQPPWDNTVKPVYVSTKARLVGILGSAPTATTDTQLKKMATDSGAVDAANGNAPLVFNGADANAAAAIQQGILTLANGLPLDINAVTVDDGSDTVDAIESFVSHLETLQLGTAQCADGLTDVDTNSDSFDDKYIQVRTGTPVCWKVVSKPNTTVPATDVPQLFKAKVKVYGDGVTQLDERDVFFLVPPAPADGPIF